MFAAYVSDFIEGQKVFNARQEETNTKVERRRQQITDDQGDLIRTRGGANRPGDGRRHRGTSGLCAGGNSAR